MFTLPGACVVIADAHEEDQLFFELGFAEYSPLSEIEFVCNADELLHALNNRTTSPRLILIDLNLPESGGLALLTSLRATAQYQTTPIVMLTATNRAEDREQALALGANDLVRKPYSTYQLGQLIQSFHKKWLTYPFSERVSELVGQNER